MATAVESAPTHTTTAKPGGSLAVASILGALLVLAGIVLVGYVIPHYWSLSVSPALAGKGSFLDVTLRLVVQILAAVALFYIGPRLAGDNPMVGIRGGILIVISWLIATFFIARAVGLNAGESIIGQVLTATVIAGSVYGMFKFLTSKGGEERAIALEQQGWLSTFSYKKTQGLKVRRCTIIGLLIVGWSGVYTISEHTPFGIGEWLLAMPFGLPTIPFLKDIQFTIPILVAIASLWLAWRAVNMPVFADFLIATEAEMNKVVWTPRKRLIQDTVVVLTTLFIMTSFLFVIDLFWGWALSLRIIGVLPPQKESREQIDPLMGRKLDW